MKQGYSIQKANQTEKPCSHTKVILVLELQNINTFFYEIIIKCVRTRNLWIRFACLVFNLSNNWKLRD